MSTVADLLRGNDELRRQIGLHYAATGVSVSVHKVIVTNSALEALNLRLMAVTRSGDVVAAESPRFHAALKVIERLDLRAVEIPVDAVTSLDLDALAAALGKHPVRGMQVHDNPPEPDRRNAPG